MTNVRITPSKNLAVLFAVILVCTLVGELTLSIRHQSQTIDEGFHLVAGYRYWQCHDFGINSEHPPLVKFVAAAPLWLGGAPSPVGDCGHEPTDKGYGYGLGVTYLYGGGVDADAFLFRARLATSIFVVLLATGCFLFGQWLFGDIAGLIALAFVVFEPNLLAHGALITTDSALSALMLLTVLSVYRYHERRSLPWLGACGICTGLTLSAKHSGILIIPILLLLILCEFFLAPTSPVSATRPRDVRIPKRVLEFAVILAIGIVILWGMYGFRFSARPHGATMSIPLSGFITVAKEQGTTGFMLTQIVPHLARWHFLPEAYLYGLVDVLSVSNPGQPPYILGKLYPHGRWFYFPVTFVVKSTLAFLSLLGIALLAGVWKGRERFRKLIYLMVPPVVLLMIATQSGLNIGYRHVLPVVGFLCVLIGGTASMFAAKHSIRKILISALIVAHVASSLNAYPNYLPYSNELWGGPRRTYRHLTDANVDWGQGLYQTRDYLASRNVHDCWIAYDGAAKTSYYGISCRTMTANQDNFNQVPPRSVTGTFVLSALTTSGIEWEPGALHPYLPFRSVAPDDVIGGAMLVYHGTFDLSGVAAVTHIARSNSMRDSSGSQALAEAQAAIALTPDSVRAHLALGRSLAALERKAEARDEFEKALALAHETGDEWYPIQIADARRELRRLPALAARQ